MKMENGENLEAIENEESSSGPYCKDVTAILTKSVHDHATEKKVMQQLKREQLKNKHDQIEKKIATICEKIEGLNQEHQELDRQIYTATEEKNQAFVRFERTSAIIQVLRDETTQIQECTKKIDAAASGIANRVIKLEKEKCKLRDLKKTKEELESKIQNIMNSPQPSLDEKLLRAIQERKNRRNQLVANINTKKIIKNNNDQLRSKKFTLLDEIFDLGEKNSKKKHEIELKRQQIWNNEQNLVEKFSLLEQKIKEMAEERDKLILEQQKMTTLKNDTTTQTEKMKSLIEDKKKALQEINENIAAKKETIQNEINMKRQIYDAELETFNKIEADFQDANVQNEQILAAISKSNLNFTELKNRQAELSCKLYEKKTELFAKQQSHAAEKVKLNDLNECLSTKTSAVDSLKQKITNLDKVAYDFEVEINEFPAKKAEIMDKAVAEHTEKITVLQKELNYQKASIELAEYEVSIRTKKIEELKSQISDIDEQMKWRLIEQEFIQKNLKILSGKIEQEERNFKKLNSDLSATQAQKQLAPFEPAEKTEERSMKITETTEEQKKNEVKNTQENKQDKKDQNEIEVVEMEETPWEVPSGRKSPGILKSPFRKPNPSQNKRVTFEGLSSTDSSSYGAKSPEHSLKDDDDVEMDEITRNWIPDASVIKRKRRLDF
ncbi:flagellar attachment zone protein 1-like [Anthonomus grandis grandis]|uniref:flagellar attachment zone protein 1-like n=1 Tax=Anthonomus grandis grandis TaxID=2921223 RepID=UPI0021651735|nr:flagellar attachment zone protein 1-like [Anthonomus grandis grandis]